jgi:DNA modification methylase
MSKIDLYKGDCLEVMDELIGRGVVVDAIITDPPYGTTACKWDSVIPFDEMWLRLNKLIKPNGAIVLFGSEPFSSALRMSNIKNYKYDWIWSKSHPTNFALVKKQPMKYHEMVHIFYKKQCVYNPQMVKGAINHGDNRHLRNEINISESQPTMKAVRTETYKSGMKYPSSIQKFNSHNRADLSHPTQKPVPLMEYLIKTYTNENELVLDFTMGSGTTGVACKNLNRKFIGIELDDKYFEIAKKRIEDTVVE